MPAELESAFAECAARWRAVAFATTPADRAEAEEGVRLAYATAGLTPPDTVIWCGSPAEASRLAMNADASWGGSVREQVRTRSWNAARTELSTLLGGPGWARAWQLAATLAPIITPLCRRIRESIATAYPVDDRMAARAATTRAVLGQHDAAWLAVFEAAARHIEGFESWAKLAGIARVAENAGWWWPYENAVLIAERTDRLHLDELGRLHNGDGPALSYPDGFALHAWSGMTVPADFVDSMRTLTPTVIHSEPNAELRRVMFEYYGYDRFLQEAGAVPVHQDEAGKLWRIEMRDDEAVVMVEVVNSTPEPDGTFSVYWLRVPPSTRTAREGVAWTFGLDAAAYQPVVQA